MDDVIAVSWDKVRKGVARVVGKNGVWRDEPWPWPTQPGETAYRDEHPDRYGPVFSGDFCVFPIGTSRHFVQVHVADRRWTPVNKTACGVPMPNWRVDPKSYPMCGVVDCPRCLEIAAAEAEQKVSSDEL